MEPILGLGTLLQVNRGSGFVTIAKNVEIGQFGVTASDVETTNHESTLKEFIRGIPDPGELPFTGLYVADASQTALMADMVLGNAAVNYPYQIVLPDGYGVFSGTGYVKQFQVKPNLDGRLECSGAIKMSGVPTFTTTQSAGLTTPFFVIHDNGTDSVDIVPVPAQGTTDYVAEIDTTATTATITPTAAAGVITVNGAVVPSGTPSQTIALGGVDSVVVVPVTVTEDNKIAKSYTIRLVRT